MLSNSIIQNLKEAKHNFKVTQLKDIKKALIFKYGSLTNASEILQVNYIFLSHVLAGRIYYVYIIKKLQEDLNLTNEQVLQFWPLLKKWPKDKKSA
ncbi:MAG: hypothetical protein WHV26_03585 [Spirochaetota bacterium]